MKVLVSDKLAEEGVEILRREKDIEVDVKTGLSTEQLKEIIGEYDAIIVRSATKLTAEVISAAERLKVICRAGVGVDNVDVRAASRKGIIVMNTPGGNTTSTAEHTMGLLMALVRNIPQAVSSMKTGKWDRKKFTGTQLAGKTLGIIGLGRVGVEVARRARAFDMKVIAYDPYIGQKTRAAEGVTMVQELGELLREADIITIHTPLTPETKRIIGKQEFEMMKKGARLINCARGGIVDEEALYEAVKSGKLSGAALDVYEKEPPEELKLARLENVVVTPHLGASTDEAQVAVAVDAAHQVVDALHGREVRFTVNFPSLDERVQKELAPYARLAEKMGLLQMQLSSGRPKKLSLHYSGEIARKEFHWVTIFYTIGLLRPVLGEHLNMVNAPVLAEERGIEIEQIESSQVENFSTAITATLETDAGKHLLIGTVFDREFPRIVRLEDFEVEIIPEGDMLVLFEKDRPGLIADVGRVLGDVGINIGRMTFGRKSVGGEAITVLNLDQPPEREVLERIRQIPDIHKVFRVQMD